MTAVPEGLRQMVGGAGWILAIVTLMGIIVRQFVPWRKITLEAEGRLIDKLTERVDKLELALSTEREARAKERLALEERLERQREGYEQKIDRLQASNDATQKIARHELRNAQERFRSLVMLLKRLPNPPEGLSEILAAIDAMETDHRNAEALEKGAQAGSRIAETQEGQK